MKLPMKRALVYFAALIIVFAVLMNLPDDIARCIMYFIAGWQIGDWATSLINKYIEE